MQRVRHGVALLVAGLVLVGCSPSDYSAVGLSDKGVPVLVNCGAYFTGVAAFDADSGRLVWSAEKPKASGYGVGTVEIGVLPEKDWIEAAAFQMTPVPAKWRFVVSRRDNNPVTMEVATATLSVDQVVIFGSGKKESVGDFNHKTCSDGPDFSTGAGHLLLLFSLPVSLLIGIVVFFARRKRRVNGSS